MQKIRKRGRCITLIEIMIVMFLIALITGVIAYNYRGTLDEGKAFKTKAGMERLLTILNLKAADDSEFTQDIETKWKDAVKHSPLVQNPNAIIKDGWGEEYQVSLDENGSIKIRSKKYEQYLESHKESLFKQETQE